MLQREGHHAAIAVPHEQVVVRRAEQQRGGRRGPRPGRARGGQVRLAAQVPDAHLVPGHGRDESGVAGAPRRVLHGLEHVAVRAVRAVPAAAPVTARETAAVRQRVPARQSTCMPPAKVTSGSLMPSAHRRTTQSAPHVKKILSQKGLQKGSEAGEQGLPGLQPEPGRPAAADLKLRRYTGPA